jgi:hypothetical protein
MANYFWDLGFDGNAIPNVRTKEYLLPNGFVLMQGQINNQSCNIPATPINVSIGDTVEFNIFNITSDLPQGAAYSIKEGSITFQNAVPQTDQNGNTIMSPFKNPDGSYVTSIPISAIPAPTGNGPSVIFSGIQAPQAATLQNPTQFPLYFCGSQTVACIGRFLMSLSVTVNGPNGLITYTDDPEMIVEGPAG